MANGNIPSRQNFNFFGSNGLNPAKDKKFLFNQYYSYMLNRTLQMFEYEGLPETIPKKDLEFIIQNNGHATITNVDGKLYAFSGELGGELNEYYLPTLSVVANPYLRFSKTLEINKDCVVILNDSLYYGLRNLFLKYSDLLASTDISIYWSIVNGRMQRLYEATDSDTLESAKTVFNDLESGSKISIVASNSFIESLKSTEYSAPSSGNMQSLIEMRQYLLASWYIDLGLSANYNMKRESLNENELNADEDVMLPLIDDMLQQRELGLKRINEMFGTNITVKLSSSWAKIREDIELSQEAKDEESNEDINKIEDTTEDDNTVEETAVKEEEIEDEEGDDDENR